MKKLVMLVLAFFMLQGPITAFADELTFSSGNGDKVSIMKDIRIDKKTTGDVVAIMGNLNIDQNVDGDVVVIMGDVTVNARVSGDVVAVFGKVNLLDKAEVGRDVVSIGDIHKSAEAKIGGQEVSVNMGFLTNASWLFIILMSVFAIFVLIIGLLAVMLSKQRFIVMTSGSGSKFGKRLAMGFLVYLGLTLFMPLLSITLVAPFVYFVLLVLAEVVVSIFLGKLLIKPVSMDINPLLEFFTGFVLITAIKIVLLVLMPRIGYISGGIIYLLFGTLINSLGTGVLIDSRFGAAAASSDIK